MNKTGDIIYYKNMLFYKRVDTKYNFLVGHEETPSYKNGLLEDVAESKRAGLIEGLDSGKGKFICNIMDIFEVVKENIDA